jgi:hypothetical protein
LALELYLSGLWVLLLSSQVIPFLLMVGHIATGTLVQRREPGCLLGENLTVDVVTHAWLGIVVDVIRVILRVIRLYDAREDGASWHVTADEVLQLEGCRRILDPKRKVLEVVPEVVRRREHLTDGDLVVDIGQHAKHLAAVQHGGVWAQITSDLSAQDLENCS